MRGGRAESAPGVSPSPPARCLPRPHTAAPREPHRLEGEIRQSRAVAQRSSTCSTSAHTPPAQRAGATWDAGGRGAPGGHGQGVAGGHGATARTPGESQPAAESGGASWSCLPPFTRPGSGARGPERGARAPLRQRAWLKRSSREGPSAGLRRRAEAGRGVPGAPGQWGSPGPGEGSAGPGEGGGEVPGRPEGEPERKAAGGRPRVSEARKPTATLCKNVR